MLLRILSANTVDQGHELDNFSFYLGHRCVGHYFLHRSKAELKYNIFIKDNFQKDRFKQTTVEYFLIWIEITLTTAFYIKSHIIWTTEML